MAAMKMLRICATVVVAIAVMPHGLLAYSGENYVVYNLDPNGDNFLALRTCGSGKCTMTNKLPPDAFLLTMNLMPRIIDAK